MIRSKHSSVRPMDSLLLLLLSCFSRVWLCDPMDFSPPGSSVQGILEARILEWVATLSSRDLLDPGIEPPPLMSPALAGGSFTTSTTWEAQKGGIVWLTAYFESYMWASLVGFPGGTSGKESACQCKRCKRGGFNPWFRKIPWRRKRQPSILAWRISWTEGEAWQATVYRVAKSRAWLKQLSMQAYMHSFIPFSYPFPLWIMNTVPCATQ